MAGCVMGHAETRFDKSSEARHAELKCRVEVHKKAIAHESLPVPSERVCW
jgi:hypothetical protein